MMTMQSFSSDKDTDVADAPEEGRKRSSFSRVFSYSLLAFFALQVIVGTVMIVLFIGGEMSQMLEVRVKSELNGRSSRLGSYISDRLLILEDYAKLPVLIAGVMQSDEHLGNTVDLVESLPFLKSDVQFALYDFQGVPIYSKWTSNDTGSPEIFQRLIEGDQDSAVELVTGHEWEDGQYWKLSVPILYHGLPEGVLSAYFPVRMREMFPEASDDMEIVLLVDGQPLSSMGEAAEPVIALDSKTEFPGISLQQAVSERIVNSRIEYLIYVMLASLIIGNMLLMLVVRRLGHRFLLVPHERLQEMSDDLEREIEKQTSDLKMRTVQLSIEIRERREAEVEARETSNLVSALLEGIGAAFFIVNPETQKIIRSNKVVQDMFGLAPWQLSERTCADMFNGFSDSMADLTCPETVKKIQYREGMATHADGTKFPVLRYLIPMELQGVSHIGIVMINITERKNLERQLNTAQKLESVGELASGIAHEINTPIQYVGDSVRFIEEAVQDMVAILNAEAELAERCRNEGAHKDLTDRIADLEDDADVEFIVEEIPKACTRALEGTDRVAHIVRAMKNFAHPGTGEMVPVDINQALENTIVVSKNEWKYVADIVRDFDPVPMVKCFPGDINQVLLNILVNGAHAIAEKVGNSGEKGTITLTTRATDDDLIVSIGDTGTGIAEENISKIFDPFFTTKEVGRGTGQGLAIVHDIIVERHGGSIDMESEVGKGTTFIITLPLKNE